MQRLPFASMLPLVLAVVPVGAVASADYSRPFLWRTVSGVPPFGFRDATGALAQFAHPTGLAVAPDGTVYVTDTTNCVIRAISSSGVVTTLAGQQGINGYRDGTGSSALLQYPTGVVRAPDGNLYVTDGAQVIRRVTPAGVVTTVAGSAWTLGSADGQGTAATFWNPGPIAVDAAGNLYVGDTSNLTVRKITPAFTVTTLAGQAHVSGSQDGVGPAAQFASIGGLAVDSAGNVYVADGENHTIRKITPGGTVTTIAGQAGQAGTADGTGSAARFHRPAGLAWTASGSLAIADSGNETVRLMTPAGVVTTLAGTALSSGSADGSGASARFDAPAGVAADGSGNLYVTDSGNSTVRRVTAAGVVSTFAGTAAAIAAEVDGSASAARFTYPWGLARNAAGNAYVSDYYAGTIRVVTPAGVASTLAGAANQSGSQDGVGSAARFDSPAGLAVDSGGAVFVADSGNHVIRRVAPDGTVTTFAGAAGVAAFQDGTGRVRLRGSRTRRALRSMPETICTSRTRGITWCARSRRAESSPRSPGRPESPARRMGPRRRRSSASRPRCASEPTARFTWLTRAMARSAKSWADKCRPSRVRRATGEATTASGPRPRSSVRRASRSTRPASCTSPTHTTTRFGGSRRLAW
jgi:sugar lactone lactonase YvrE